jgi:trans-aconitate methyltransferase
MDAAASITGLYTRHGAAWARDRGDAPGTEAAWIARLLALLPPAAHVLDIGCGSGAPIATAIASAGHRVTGLDASPTLLDLARARLPDAEWIEADMRAMDLGRRFDALVAWDSFFHLDHDAQRGMLPRFAAHAVPGAPLLFTSGPRHGVAMGSYAGEPLFHASLDPAEYRALLAAHGFEVLDHRAEDPAGGGHTVWLARRA